ncbi:MAG: PorP/SprF family type IX secretion system membrane protein [Bacteroidales bacterium]|jgi:type IX secretion system PorP/SprF family membrane protein|nr:PorP/SprF family type IX secretion system membrane protein [Bacteroidales bacterium]
MKTKGKNTKIQIIGITIALVAIFTQSIDAQQYPLSYMYDRYKYTVNPAALRIGEGVGLHASYCNDWYNNAYDNRFYGFGAEGGFFKQNMGIGLVLTQENSGLLAQTNIKVSYAYRVQLKEEHWLSFGISAGYSHLGLRKVDMYKGLGFDETDPLIGMSQNGFFGAFGLQYKWKALEIDAAIPTYNTINKKHVPVFGSISYTFKIKEDWGLKPILMYNFLNPDMHHIDGRLQASYKDYAWLQVGFRNTKELVVAAGGEVKNVQIGAAFGFNVGSYNQLNQGNLEVVVGYRFANAVVKTTRSEKDATTRSHISKITDDVSTLKKANDKHSKELEKINTSIAELNEQIRTELKNSLTEIKEEVQSIRKEDIVVDETKVLDKQYFVIVFVTTTQEDADRIVNRMAQQKVKGQIIRDARKSNYYIYTETYDNLQAAVKQADKEKSRGFSGAWVLVVR